MTKDEMDIFRKIANQLERIADALTGEHIEEKSLAELQEELDIPVYADNPYPTGYEKYPVVELKKKEKQNFPNQNMKICEDCKYKDDPDLCEYKRMGLTPSLYLCKEE